MYLTRFKPIWPVRNTFDYRMLGLLEAPHQFLISLIHTSQSLRTSASCLDALVCEIDFSKLLRSTLLEFFSLESSWLVKGLNFELWGFGETEFSNGKGLAKNYRPPSGMANFPVLAVFRTVMDQWLQF